MMRLKEIRLDKGLTQTELAKLIFTSQTNIGRWENGENEPTSSSLVKLAKALNCSIDYILGLEDDFGVINNKNEDSFLNKNERQLLYDFNELSPIRQEMLKEKISDWLEIEKLQKK